MLGVPALFSTAYGNVGLVNTTTHWASSPRVPSGLTPLVFTLTGLLFVTTAWSYAEAAAMMPEAGGASSFARRAFNEFVSFGAGWALMLDYIVTIAISAFFVPNYLAGLWPALKTWPLQHHRRHHRHPRTGRDQRRRHKGGRTTQHRPRRPGPRDAGPHHDHRRRPVVAPRLLIDQTTSGRLRRCASSSTDLHRNHRLHRHRDDLEHGRGGVEPRRDVPRAINMVLVTVVVIYIGMSLVALSAMAPRQQRGPRRSQQGTIMPRQR